MKIQLIDYWNGSTYDPINGVDFFEELSQKAYQRLRMEINDTRNSGAPPTLRCSLCKEPLYIRSKSLSDKHEYFPSHHKALSEEQELCPQRSHSHIPIEVIRALKYQGAAESKLHHDLKHRIAEILRLDSSIPSDTIYIERTIKVKGEWRKPDVQVSLDGLVTAFEVQVSTEMAPMISVRQYFYQKFGRIIWVMPHFDPGKIRQSQIDIAVTNNDHLFVLDDEMIQLSVERKELHLRCWIHVPYRNASRLEYEWQQQTIGLSDVQFKNGHPYVVDVEAIESEIKAECELIEEKKQPTTYPTYTNKVVPSQRRLWGRWSSICESITDDAIQKHLISTITKKYQKGSQSSHLLGILLRLYGLNWKDLQCKDTTLALLQSAADGHLHWENQSWKWAGHQVCQNHSRWFSPFLKLLKKSNVWPLDDLIESSIFQETYRDLKKTPIYLTYKEKNLLSLMFPDTFEGTENNPIKYNLIDFETNGFCYTAELRAREESDILDVVFSDFDGYKTACSREEISKGLVSRDLERMIHYHTKSNRWLPMPNLPPNADYEAINFPVGSTGNDNFFDKIDYQLLTLEKELRSITS
ncbi:DUF6035 family protein [Neptunomonas sp. XY-337]|uniref:DUF6035 family protein n=1 Tax=Neptunomonas sp. XY-337 TaxID=2561897 RepID=UPI0010A9C832|nr:DUF6035 family protein [Neptunomonas sp. XY-337]